MKQGTLATRIVMLVLFLGVVAYMGFYAAKRLSDPYTTVLAYEDTLDDAVEVTGVVVREETVLSGGAAIMDVLPEEGARVGAGQTVAVLYQNSGALDRKTELDAMEIEREQLQYALNSGNDLENAAQLESQIVSSLLRLRTACSGGDLSSLSSDVAALRTQVLQREFAYSGTADSATALQSALDQLDEEILALRAQAAYDTSAITAPCAGLFSGVVDGYESILTPTLLETVSAQQLIDLCQGTSTPAEDQVGKLITGTKWYFACVLPEASADRLQPGDTVTIAFSRDFSQDVVMQVDRVGEAEEEGCVVVFSSTHYLKDVTLLRMQTVSVVFQRYEGIRVPKQALRLLEQTSTDPDSGEQTLTQVTGVFTVVGGTAEFKAVEIVREGSDYYLVQPADSTSVRKLRVGDEVIVEASDLYDGKVVLE